MMMRFTEFLLLGCVVALGVTNFRDERAASRRRLTQMLQRERELQQDVSRLRQRKVALGHEARALRDDPYYIERRVREDLAWLPIQPVAPASPLGPPGGDPGSAVVQNLLKDPRAPAPQPVAPDRGQEFLAALGYGSPAHFQRKMMQGKSTGALDGTTVARARDLLAMVQRTGCPSVKAFQAKQGLPADGVLGRQTEQRLRDVVRDRGTRRGGSGRSGIVVHGGERDGSRPGG
jgi:murein L,D-transpeptidase YcbB/YkuD